MLKITKYFVNNKQKQLCLATPNSIAQLFLTTGSDSCLLVISMTFCMNIQLQDHLAGITNDVQNFKTLACVIYIQASVDFFITTNIALTIYHLSVFLNKFYWNIIGLEFLDSKIYWWFIRSYDLKQLGFFSCFLHL